MDITLPVALEFFAKTGNAIKGVGARLKLPSPAR